MSAVATAEVEVSIPGRSPIRHRCWSALDPFATVILSTGVMSHAGWWAPIAPDLARGGLRVIGADRRGSGLNTEGRGDAPSAQVLVEDLVAVARHYPDLPLFLAGWCWGAVLTLAAQASLEGCAGLMLFAPGLFPTELIKARARTLEAKAEFGAEDAPTLESPITDDLFTDGPSRAFIAQDPLALRRYSPRFRSVMSKLGFTAGARLRRLELPTLLVLAEEDRVTDNAATLAAFAHLPRLERVELPGAHGLMFDAPGELTRVMLDFCQRHR